MVDMTAPYAGDYMKSSDLPPNMQLPVVIMTATVELIGQEQKPMAVLGLARWPDKAPWPRKVPLNKTNAGLCADKFGKDSAGWVDQKITIWNDPTVLFKGERVGGFKVAIGHLTQPAATSAAIPLPGPVAQPVPGNGADPVAAGAAMNMGGQTVPLPAGMPFTPSTMGVPLPTDTPTPSNPAKPVWAGPGSDLDDALPL